MDKLQLLVLILGLISTAQSGDEESREFCDETISCRDFGKSINITSPGYPGQYNTATSCILTFSFDTFTPSVLGISQYIPTNAGCSVPYDIFNSNGSKPRLRYRECSTSNDRTLYTNEILITSNSTSELQIVLPAGSGDGFIFTFTVLPLLTMQQSDSMYKVDVMSTPAAYIASHQGSGEIKYENNVTNQLTLQNLADVSSVTIDFVSFNLGTLASCAGQPYDVLKVFGNEKSDLLYDCGDTSNKPAQQILDTRSYNSLLFEFVTDGENDLGGFLLYYSVKSDKVDNASTTTGGTKKCVLTVSSPFSTTQAEHTPRGDDVTSTNNITTTVLVSTTKSMGNKILQVAVGAGSGIFLLIVVAIILSCILGRRYNDRLSSKKRANMNAYEESDQNDGDQTRPIPGRVRVDPFNQYSEVDLSCYASRNLQERMAESGEPIPDPTNHYFTIEEPDGACSSGTGTPYTDSQVRYADNNEMPMSTFSSGTTSPTEMEPNPYSEVNEPEISTNLRFPAKTRPDPANQYSDIDLSPAPANEMEDANHYWELEHTNDRQMNTASDPHQTAEVTRTTARNVYHDVEPSVSSEGAFRVDEEPSTSSEEPATEGDQKAPVYSMNRKNPAMVDNSLYEAN